MAESDGGWLPGFKDARSGLERPPRGSGNGQAAEERPLIRVTKPALLRQPVADIRKSTKNPPKAGRVGSGESSHRAALKTRNPPVGPRRADSLSVNFVRRVHPRGANVNGETTFTTKNSRPADASRALARPHLKPRGQLVPPRRQKPGAVRPTCRSPSRASRAAGAPATRPLGPPFAPPKRELKAPFPDPAENFPDPPI
jgi:hypothetical protein